MNRRANLPSQTELKNLFRYNRKGFFIRKIKTGQNTFVGQEVKGSLHHSGYLQIKLHHKTFLMHKLVFVFHRGCAPDTIDHKNRKRHDNRIEDLIPSNGYHNQRNRKQDKRNKSGVRGVSFDTRTKLWRCRVMVKGVRINVLNSRNKKTCCQKCKKFFKGVQ